ncbi:IS66 family insertion sequence element accessory protein TnpB [Mesorhizobium composti]|uniref:IS66 family insertion sequence element accessory protein TnpB n=1 Tax=Ollibium composti TaxID=2675109 RepID=A0ABY2QAU7_9HYPH|nr:IS66 family insertion sequence element accessory protein TnpB [Mesorhizobium composti]
MVATKPVDFRKGAEGLAALVRETMGADPFSGTVYVFRAKRADRVKLVYFDGTGVCLLAKRLEDGKFCWPAITDGVVRLSAAQLQALLEGRQRLRGIGTESEASNLSERIGRKQGDCPHRQKGSASPSHLDCTNQRHSFSFLERSVRQTSD